MSTFILVLFILGLPASLFYAFTSLVILSQDKDRQGQVIGWFSVILSALMFILCVSGIVCQSFILAALE